jgi:methionyl-tRNA synthetase
MPDKFDLTTPIYYVNARPHIGHTYTTIVADAIARRKRAQGIDTWFLTGTDEHGQKIERSARAAGLPPQAFTDKVSAEFRALWDRMDLSYDDFIRTTEPRHQRGAQKLFALLRDNGYIYKGSYTGQYCVFDELYVDGEPGTRCPDCGRLTETVSEENYFFKLSAFERTLLEFYDAHPDFIRPAARRNEVISFVRGGLKDLSVSRTSFAWGIPVPTTPASKDGSPGTPVPATSVPGDEKHVIYVWLDALANYITALGYGSDAPEDQARFEKYWPADLHIIGKEISRFHCVYWPAFLMAAGLPLPKSIVAHGWLLFEESKMSKSRGNIVRSETILDVLGDHLGADALRYFLLREIVFGQDGSFSFDALVGRYNSDLANGYGNLVSRTLAMIAKYFDGIVPAPTALQADSLATAIPASIDAFHGAFDALDFARALESVWAIVAATDGYLTASAPWKQSDSISDDQQRALRATVLYTAAESIRIITALVYPVLPHAAAKVWAQLGLGDIAQADLQNLAWGGLKPGTRLGELGPVFPRAEKDAITRMKEIEEKNAAAAAPSTPDPKPDPKPVSKAAPKPASKPASEPASKQSSKSNAKQPPQDTNLDPARGTPAMPPPPKTGRHVSPTPAHESSSHPENQPDNQPDNHPEKQTPYPAHTVAIPAPAETQGAAAAAGQEAPTGTASSLTRAAPTYTPAASTPATSAPATSTPSATAPEKITIDDFTKIDLRVALITLAERVPKADKLLRLEVDLGYEQRQILAGIAEAYSPESLVGRKVVIVANLAPRKLRGLESNGMIVAASLEGGRPVLAGFLEEVPIGARLK